MKMIIAFVRTTCLEHVVKSLEEIGISGISVSEVKGVGEQAGVFTPHAVHNMLNIIAPDGKAKAVTESILRCAHTGLPGDGLIAVMPLDHVMEIRTKQRMV